MDVSVDVHRFAYAAAVHVGFIRQDHGRGDRRDRRSLGLLVVGDRRDDRHEVGALHPVAEALIDEDPAGLPVGVAGERVPDVVQVSGDARELRLTFGEIEPVQDLVADVGDQVRVPEAVLRVAHRVHHAVRRGDGLRPVGDNHPRQFELPDRIADLLLAGHVEMARRFVQQQDLRLLVQRASQQHALFLAA